MLDDSRKRRFSCRNINLSNYTSAVYEENDDVLLLNKRKFSKNILFEELKFVSTHIRKQWIFIQNLVLLDSNPPFRDIVEARLEVSRGLAAIYQLTQNSTQPIRKKMLLDTINSIACAVLPLESLEEKNLIKICYSSKKESNCPVHEYLHCFLDIHLYILLIKLNCDITRDAVAESTRQIINDLILLSRKHFSKDSAVQNISFICPCVGNLWTEICDIFLEKLNCDMFWEKMRVVFKDDDSLFTFWVIKDLVNLEHSKKGDMKQGVIPNFEFLKEKFVQSLKTGDDISEHLKMLYTIIEKLPNDRKLEFLLIVWDHFSKRLNISTKYKSGMIVDCVEFTELLDIIILSPRDCYDEFEIFIGLLYKYLAQQPNHWGKVKSRIFSQLSPFKIGNLDEVGVYRVFQLLIGLMQVNYDELSKKIISICESLKGGMMSSAVINIYVSFLIRMVRENRSIEKTSIPLVKALLEASTNQKNFFVIKEFLRGLNHIVKFSRSMQLHQWTLIDKWVIKYLATCYHPDLESALRTILSLLRKVHSEDTWACWEDTFKTYIYPVLKQIGICSTCPPAIGELAAVMSKLSPDILNDTFRFFTAEAINHKVTEIYLRSILKYYPTEVLLTELQENTAIQCWLRICLYSTHNYEEITSLVLKLESLPLCIKKGITNFSDPLVNFIEILGSNKNLFLNSKSLCRFCEMCFDNLDQSLILHLPQIKNEMVILRIYTCLSIALLQCNTLLYDRHKASSPATKLISALLFPTEFVMGKIAHPFLDSIRKTWHLYFEALLKLGQDNDTYVQRTLRDLISKYIPFYSVSESPIYLCLTRETSARVILEKFSLIYFKHPTRENEQNVTKALKILNEYVKSSTSATLLNIVVQETLFGLCEIYIFHNQKNLALSIIIFIVTCQFYDQLKEEIIKGLLLLTEKHLAFNSKAYFSLMNILAKTIPSEISILKESIVEKIRNIERIRGIGYDDNLRSYLSVLNASLDC